MTHLDHADVRALSLGRVIVTAWHKKPRAEVIGELEKAVSSFHDAHPDGAVLVIVPTLDSPDEQARNALRDLLLRTKGLVGAAVVLAVGGLKGKVLRGIASGAVAAMRLPFDVKLVGANDEAARLASSLLRARDLDAPSSTDIEHLIRRASA
jgi:hypothetical protein